MSNRRKQREFAVQILYGIDFWELDAESALDAHRVHFQEHATEDSFLGRVIRGIVSNRDEIDDLIRQFSTNWRLERMAIVDRNILRLATFELRHLNDIPRKVSINEAIEVAKKFGGDDSPSFINGILDRVALEIRGPESDEERAAAEEEAAPASEAEAS